MRALPEMPVAISKSLLTMALAVPMMALLLHSAFAQDSVSLTLGQNAYVLQDETGFPMGYPTRSDGTGPVGGQRAGVDADLMLGPVRITCDGALLVASQMADVVHAGRLFCPIGDNVPTVVALRDQISASAQWDRHQNHTASARRAQDYGTTVADAFAYLSAQTMRGTVMRVPLYNWRSNAGLFVELNATRHADQGAVLSYELSFTWGNTCLIRETARQIKTKPTQTDRARAADVQARLPELCAAELKALTPPFK